MPGVVFKVEGLDALTANLRALGRDIRPGLGRSGKKGMLVLEGRIKEICPVQTGNLRDSYNTQVIDDSEGLGVTTGTNVEYALSVEYGRAAVRSAATRAAIDKYGGGNYGNTGSRPHVRPALDQTQGRIQEVVRDEIVKEIRRLVR